MASFLDVCRFTAVSTGTGDFVVSVAATGYQTPASAQAADAAIYKYRAESTDLSQWEVGYGAYTVSSTTLARTTVLYNSAGTQAKISFSAAPQVAIVGLAEDLNPVDGSIFGLALSTAGSSATFTTAVGWAADSTAVNILRLYASLAKTTSAWAVGATNGSLDTGAIANSTWYHAYIIKRLDTGVTDVLTSLSATAPTMPTSYTLKRRIGAMKTNGSAQWTKFIQDGDLFMWDVPVNDVNATNPGTAAVTRTLTVPTGVRLQALMSVGGFGLSSDAGTNAIYISDLSLADGAAAQSTNVTFQVTAPNSGTLAVMGQAVCMTNTSAQVRSRVQSSSGTNAGIVINTNGWRDTRGKDS